MEHLLLAEVEFAAYLAVNLRPIRDLFTGEKRNEDWKLEIRIRIIQCLKCVEISLEKDTCEK